MSTNTANANTLTAPATQAATVAKLTADILTEYAAVVAQAKDTDLKASKSFGRMMKHCFSFDSRKDQEAVLGEVLDVTAKEADASSVTAKLLTRIKSFYKYDLKATVKTVKVGDVKRHVVALSDESPELEKVRGIVSTKNGSYFNIWKPTQNETDCRKSEAEFRKAKKQAEEVKLSDAMQSNFGDDPIAKELTALYFTVQSHCKDQAEAVKALRNLNQQLNLFFQKQEQAK